MRTFVGLVALVVGFIGFCVAVGAGLAIAVNTYCTIATSGAPGCG